jgi:hypothetical protein
LNFLNIFLLLFAIETTAFHFQTIVADQALNVAALDLTELIHFLVRRAAEAKLRVHPGTSVC